MRVFAETALQQITLFASVDCFFPLTHIVFSSTIFTKSCLRRCYVIASSVKDINSLQRKMFNFFLCAPFKWTFFFNFILNLHNRFEKVSHLAHWKTRNEKKELRKKTAFKCNFTYPMVEKRWESFTSAENLSAAWNMCTCAVRRVKMGGSQPREKCPKLSDGRALMVLSDNKNGRWWIRNY